MRYALAIAVVLASFGAQAQPPAAAGEAIPLLDVDKACAALADRTPKTGLVPRSAALNACLQEEQDGYDTARLFWDDLTSDQRGECLRHAGGFGAANFYRALGVCAEGKHVAGQVSREMRQPPGRFRY